jgi:hypothetical protein
MIKNTYAIRRAILEALKEYKGAPLMASEFIACCPNSVIRLNKPEDVQEEWKNLKLHGYIQPIQGFGGEYCEISKSGLQQIEPEFDQDFFIHGPSAIRSKP